MRTASFNRHTKETRISASVNLDGTGVSSINTGLGFLDHMLDQTARHGLIDISLEAQGDLHIDCHHTVEDVGITLGETVKQALGEKRGISRFGHSYVPLDEALSRVVIDFSGRPSLHFRANFSRDKIGNIDTETFSEFFQGFANHALATIHIDNLHGINNHHIIESIFKAFGRALRQAVRIDKRNPDQIASTKGSL
ncbi:MAG: imidazoleglycerol-phosphate dehydratase HisB [Cardiobacteriaceae bacterium]|nr:imidazoleglycerol-phosphate dehydratase HisB [Cardiobacteriaceae bacterium]